MKCGCCHGNGIQTVTWLCYAVQNTHDALQRERARRSIPYLINNTYKRADVCDVFGMKQKEWNSGMVCVSE